MCAQWPANADTNWNTKMLAYLAIGHNTDGTHSNIDGDTPTANDSDSNAMAKAHAYLAQTSGFVSAWVEINTTATLSGFVDNTADPAGAGTKVALATASAREPFVFFFVPNGLYFELTHASQTVTIIWTPLISGGSAPVDQD